MPAKKAEEKSCGDINQFLGILDSDSLALDKEKLSSCTSISDTTSSASSGVEKKVSQQELAYKTPTNSTRPDFFSPEPRRTRKKHNICEEHATTGLSR